MSGHPEIPYRRYIIRSMLVGKAWQARAFRGEDRWNVFTGETPEQAIDAVKVQIDGLWADELAKRKPDGYPTAAAIDAALEIVCKKNGGHWKMLFAHLDAADHILTATQLAKAAGYKGYVAVNLQYGLLGEALAHEMDWNPPEQKNRSAIWKWTYALAVDADEGTKTEALSPALPEWRWRLRPEIVQAVTARLPRRAELEQ